MLTHFVLKRPRTKKGKAHVSAYFFGDNRTRLMTRPEYQILSNETDTRSFVTLSVTDLSGRLQECVSAVDEVMTRFGGVAYHEVRWLV